MVKTVQITLRQIAWDLVSPDLDDVRLAHTIEAYKNLLISSSGFDPGGEPEKADIHLSGGKALGAAWAAMCVEDLIRTRMFVKGLYEAVTARLSAGKKTVRVLYAGCGPFATLALPLTTLFEPSEVQFELIEINPLSLESVRRLIRNVDLESWFPEISEADATKFRITKEPDIILSETMQRALLEEQQVPIIYNLLSQVGNRCVLVPEKIELSVGWWNPELDPDSRIRKIAPFFELSATAFDRAIAETLKQGEAVKFPGATIDRNALHSPIGGRLAVFTDIQTYGQNRILPNESGLTTPLLLAENPKENAGLKIGYALREKPAIDLDFFR